LITNSNETQKKLRGNQNTPCICKQFLKVANLAHLHANIWL